jgi:hypothetical protein
VNDWISQQEACSDLGVTKGSRTAAQLGFGVRFDNDGLGPDENVASVGFKKLDLL